jgi:uncharacterized membrane protein
MMYGYGMWWGGLIWLLLVGALIWAVVANTQPRRKDRYDPVNVVEERFARGEIDADTYRSIRSELERT